MAVTHSNAALSAATDAVTALLGTSARLKFHITGSTVAAPSPPRRRWSPTWR